ncbi:hypothetical protein GCM10011379_46720 [Filimonas zeae]|uniref:Uncharacterized protein n=1 Tax=Filimonas zeae TaxID=1737353 RepID=A0A917MY78_9BACT|nr:hypothetical protein GCM10011379_46720 [Filimonas zeae]
MFSTWLSLTKYASVLATVVSDAKEKMETEHASARESKAFFIIEFGLRLNNWGQIYKNNSIQLIVIQLPFIKIN